MTTTLSTTDVRTDVVAPQRRLLTGTALAAVVAGVATTTIAAVGHAAGISLAGDDGKAIPLAGFFMVTVVVVAIGGLLAAALRRWTHRPRRTFVVTTVALTALSLVPDAVLAADAGLKLLLVTTHLVAAAIAIPTIARRLPR